MSSTPRLQAPFADFLGIKITHVSPERVEAELPVRGELATVPDILHGGAIMAFADNVGAVGAVANLPKGARSSAGLLTVASSWDGRWAAIVCRCWVIHPTMTRQFAGGRGLTRARRKWPSYMIEGVYAERGTSRPLPEVGRCGRFGS